MLMSPARESDPARKVFQPVVAKGSPDPTPNSDPNLKASSINFYYGSFKALHDVSLAMTANRIPALIGHSGCGKSTFLRILNRINETIHNYRLEGEVLLDGEDIRAVDVTSLRRRVGMVFQRPNPFPKSIADNIAYGFRGYRIATAKRKPEQGPRSPRRAAP